MNTPMRITVLAALSSGLGFAWAVADTSHSAYAGQETRTIKSLSDQEVAGLLSGSGAGLAKAAELNGFPGPAHVLELADSLHLDASQIDATRQLMAAHKTRASQLGAELVASERSLDALFAEKRADPASIDRATRRVGALQARLRAEHLTTHLTQTALLSAEQVHRYNVLRGYTHIGFDVLPRRETPAHHGTRHPH